MEGIGKIADETILFCQILGLFLKTSPDNVLIRRYLTEPDFEFFDLQDYVSFNLKPEFIWVTAIGVIDAVESIIEDSVSNGNIILQSNERN